MTVLLLIHPSKCVKDVGNVLLLHTLPRILHGIPDAHPVNIQAFASYRQSNDSFTCIFHGIIKQIDQNLLDPHLVAAEHTGDGRIYMKLEFQSLLPRLDPYHIDDLRKERARLIRNIYDLHLSGLDLGYIQDIIDQCKQQFTGALDIPCILGNILRNISPKDDLIQSDDRIDRSTDLVAHAGKEMILSLIKLFNLLFLLL